MKKFLGLSFTKRLLAFSGLLLFPLFVSADVVGYSYDWPIIALFSLLIFLIMTLAWFVSPLGIIFVLSSLAQFLLPQKPIRIIAWVFQGMVFLFTILLGIIGTIYAFSQYGEGKYILLFSIIGAFSLVSVLMVGTMIAQVIWQRKK